MANLKLSDIIDLIPESKLQLGFGYMSQAEFDVASLVDRQMEDPLDFPSLEQAILTEDTVCIVVEPGIIRGTAIAAEVARKVHEIGVPAENISLLLAEGTTGNGVRSAESLLSEAGCQGSQVLVHDATQRDEIGFLAPSQSGEPILLNARIVHADFVIPVASVRPDGWKSDIDFMYPYFSDVDSQKRFFKLTPPHRVALNSEVNRWVGCLFRVNVISTPSGEQITVIAGEQNSVNRKSRELLQEQLPAGEKKTGDLVIAEIQPHLCVSAEEWRQTLDNLIENCNRGGTVVLLCNDELEFPRLIPPSGSNQNPETEEIANLALRHDSHSVFVISEQAFFRRLGVSRITDGEQVKRLAEQADQVLVLPDFQNDFSHHVMPETSKQTENEK